MTKISVLHLLIYQKIRGKANGGRYVSHESISEIINRSLHSFPKQYRHVFIKEMTENKLLKKMNQRFYEIIGGDADKDLVKHNYSLWGP